MCISWIEKNFTFLKRIMPHYSFRYLIYPSTAHINNNIAIVICNSVHLMVQCSPYKSESVHVYDAHIQWCHDGFITDPIGCSSDNAAGIVTDWIMYSETKLARVAALVYDNIYTHMTWLFSKLHARNLFGLVFHTVRRNVYQQWICEVGLEGPQGSVEKHIRHLPIRFFFLLIL